LGKGKKVYNILRLSFTGGRGDGLKGGFYNLYKPESEGFRRRLVGRDLKLNRDDLSLKRKGNGRVHGKEIPGFKQVYVRFSLQLSRD